MSKTFRPWEPRQAFLLPQSPQDWLPPEHLAYFILDTVEALDLSAIVAHYERELRGYPPYNPQMMVALLLYAYCVGVPSSRKIERRTYEDVAFRVITADQHPDHVRVSEFRRIHLEALAALFVQVLALCRRAGLVKLGVVALDGTKVHANASKHKAMSYDRMKAEEQKLRAQVQDLLQKAQQADEEEDRRYGKDRRGDELPEQLRRAETRLAHIRQLKAELEAEAKAQREQETKAKTSDQVDPPGAGGAAPLPEHRIPADHDGTPDDKAQRSFTDGDSRIMKGGDGYLQGYNCQAVVDAEHQVIVAEAVTNQPPDVQHWVPMLERTIANCGEAPQAALADNGYCCEENIVYALNQGIDPYLATGRLKHGEKPTPDRRPARELTLKESMTRTLCTQRGWRTYALRKTVVEPVFGQIKDARGFRRFLLRGLQKVRGEWSLITLTHNLLKLHRAAAVPA